MLRLSLSACPLVSLSLQQFGKKYDLAIPHRRQIGEHARFGVWDGQAQRLMKREQIVEIARAGLSAIRNRRASNAT